MKNWIAARLMFVNLLVVKSAFAGNMADLTAFDRMAPEAFVGVYEGNNAPRWAMAHLPISTTTAVSIKDWNSMGKAGKWTELRGIKQLTPWSDVALITKATGKDLNENIALDLRKGSLGFGLNVPLETQDHANILLGPRAKAGNATVYLTITGKGTNPMWGMSYKKSGFALELSYTQDRTKYAKISRIIKTSRGLFIPEFRTQFKPSGNLYGFGLAFCP